MIKMHLDDRKMECYTIQKYKKINMITTNLTGTLGNHMWQYAVCRTIAEKRI
jgi:hypothetical protein